MTDATASTSLRDIQALPDAISLTRVVVTDADAQDAAGRRARLVPEFGTPIFKSLTELVAYLGL